MGFGISGRWFPCLRAYSPANTPPPCGPGGGPLVIDF